MCFIIPSTKSADETLAKIEEELVAKETISPDDIKGRKGLIVVHRGPNYHFARREGGFNITAHSPRGAGNTGSGRIFVARGSVSETADGSRVEIEIPESWGIIVALFAWLAASGTGMVWNLYLSIVDGGIRIEFVLTLVLVAVAVFVLWLSKRGRGKHIERFKARLVEILA